MSVPNQAQVPFGIGPPNVLNITVTSPVGGLDLTMATGVTLDVRRPDGTSVGPWVATIQAGALPTSCNVLYALQGNEFSPYDGTWRMAPIFVVPGGVVPCYHSTLYVTVGP